VHSMDDLLGCLSCEILNNNNNENNQDKNNKSNNKNDNNSKNKTKTTTPTPTPPTTTTARATINSQFRLLLSVTIRELPRCFIRNSFSTNKVAIVQLRGDDGSLSLQQEKYLEQWKVVIRAS